MFEQAVRLKLRVQTARGALSVEQLWQLPVEVLDDAFKTLTRQVKASEEESLLEQRDEANAILDLKIAIIKHIVSTLLAEAKARQNAQENRARKAKLMEVLAGKQDAALGAMSEKQLQKMIAELG